MTMSSATTTRTILVCVVLGALAPVTACVTSSTSHCKNDLTCPSGMMCSPTGEACVDSDLVIACHGNDDGMPCTVPGLPTATCMGGVCQASRCGDGRVTGAEECDGNLLQGQNCQTRGFYEAAGLRCGPDCKFDTSQCRGYCGDGKKNGKEQCDGSDLAGATCFNAGFYKAKGLRCGPDCKYDVSSCTGGRCGDGILNGLEQCDGKMFNRASCEAMGFAGALSGLSCTANCTYSTQSCLCGTGKRCKANKQHCSCDKGGCGCVDNQDPQK
jgi:hypothetical protein